MRLMVNGEPREVEAETLEAALVELGYGGAVVATALNGDMVPKAARPATRLAEGDRVEVLAPLYGG
jgi:sulfur carrier protein